MLVPVLWAAALPIIVPSPRAQSKTKSSARESFLCLYSLLVDEARPATAFGPRCKSLALQVEGGVIEDCGHYVMEEQPEYVARELIGFFDRVEARP